MVFNLNNTGSSATAAKAESQDSFYIKLFTQNSFYIKSHFVEQFACLGIQAALKVKN